MFVVFVFSVFFVVLQMPRFWMWWISVGSARKRTTDFHEHDRLTRGSVRDFFFLGVSTPVVGPWRNGCRRLRRNGIVKASAFSKDRKNTRTCHRFLRNGIVRASAFSSKQSKVSPFACEERQVPRATSCRCFLNEKVTKWRYFFGF